MPVSTVPAIRVCCPRCGAYAGSVDDRDRARWLRRHCRNRLCNRVFAWRLVDGRVESEEVGMVDNLNNR